MPLFNRLELQDKKIFSYTNDYLLYLLVFMPQDSVIAWLKPYKPAKKILHFNSLPYFNRHTSLTLL